MIQYAYEDLFYNHTSVDYVIVDSSATVTGVANAAPTISGESFSITNSDLKAESIALKESLCSDNNLVFGKMEAANLTFTIKGDSHAPDLTDAVIDVYLYFNGNSATLFKVGRYIVDSDQFTKDRKLRNIVSYDALYYLADYDITEWYNSVYEDEDFITIQDLRESLFDWIEEEGDIPVTLASNENDGLINDDYLVGKTIESDSITFGFFMRRLLELRGCFGKINRDGEFECRWMEWYDVPPVKELNTEVIPPVQYKDVNTWYITYVQVYDRDNIRRFKIGSSSKKYPSIYTIVDSFVLQQVNRPDWKADTKEALKVMRDAITHLYYKPSEISALGNLCLEVGDRIRVTYGTNGEPDYFTFSTYILSRNFKGIQSMRDVYTSKGDKKQPKYKPNDNWHVGDSEDGAYGRSGVAEVDDEFKKKFVKCIRNIGFRLLAEPSDVVVEYDAENEKVTLKWTDPSDISNHYPVAATWAGTVVIRKENDSPWFLWDSATMIVNSTTRNEYSIAPLEDMTIEKNKKYYYGIFPYDTDGDYRFTKVISVDTTEEVPAPTITDVHMDDLDASKVIVEYTIPEAEYDYIKLVYKKGSIPKSYSDGTAITIQQSSTSRSISGIADGGTYYFAIFTDVSVSEPKEFTTVLPPLVDLWDLVLSDDIVHATWCGRGPSTAQLESNNVLCWGESDRRPTLSNGVLSYTAPVDYAYTVVSFPLKNNYTILGGKTKANFISKSQNAYHDQWILAGVGDATGTQGNQICSLSAYTYKQDYYSEFNPVHVDELTIYEDEVRYPSPVTTRRINVVFQYGTWEMLEIKIQLV